MLPLLHETLDPCPPVPLISPPSEPLPEVPFVHSPLPPAFTARVAPLATVALELDDMAFVFVNWRVPTLMAHGRLLLLVVLVKNTVLLPTLVKALLPLAITCAFIMMLPVPPIVGVLLPSSVVAGPPTTPRVAVVALLLINPPFPPTPLPVMLTLFAIVWPFRSSVPPLGLTVPVPKGEDVIDVPLVTEELPALSVPAVILVLPV